MIEEQHRAQSPAPRCFSRRGPGRIYRAAAALLTTG
jgi:hypothetical protein